MGLVGPSSTVKGRGYFVYKRPAGENIDILNGGLGLTIPIGPKYQVSRYLSYQLNLGYTSKIWDHQVYDGTQSPTDVEAQRSSSGMSPTTATGASRRPTWSSLEGVSGCRLRTSAM